MTGTLVFERAGKVDVAFTVQPIGQSPVRRPFRPPLIIRGGFLRRTVVRLRIPMIPISNTND